MSVTSFKFPYVSRRLPPYVIENVVDKWCTRDGAIRYIRRDDRTWTVYVDVLDWLPAGFEMRDKLAALKAKGAYSKSEIPVHPLKFGRYLLVCPSYTLAEHDAYAASAAAAAAASAAAAPGWDVNAPVWVPAPGWVPATLPWDASQDASWEMNVD